MKKSIKCKIIFLDVFYLLPNICFYTEENIYNICLDLCVISIILSINNNKYE
jgi:hypothetical protein